MARRRGRLRLAAFVVATVVVIAFALLASRAVSIPSPYARASLAAVGEKTRGSVAVLASKDDNEETSEARGIPSVVTWEDGVSTVSSSVSDGALFSTATVSITHIDMLDGLIVADSMDLVASAAATEDAVSGGVDVSRVEGLKVNGLEVGLDRLPLTIPGVGVLRALERRVVEVDTGLEAELVGLHLHLTSPWKALSEDADVIIGSAAACVDQESAARFLEQARAASGADDGQNGSGGGSTGGGASGGGSSGGGSSGGGSSDGGSSGGGSSYSDGGSSGGGSSSGSFRPGKMDKPSRHHRDLLAFPGAVFPVGGSVWYGDDFGAPRAVGGGHTGNDIFARRGTPVVAVQAGTVTELRYRSLGGNSFHLINDRGDYFYYAHLLRYAAGIQEGSCVEAGQVLGYVGNTGNAISTPPHLHFEIHPAGGAPIDPYPYLELWRGEAADDGEGETAEAAPSPSPAGGARAISADAERGRHEQTVLLAGVPAPREAADLGGGMLVPAAVSFGVIGGLMTSAARRRHTQFTLVTMESEALHRAARAE
jgi:murein DD-endopeptidase MepM/ murein hydrolase activator NlpD